jgi:hypothetical protein
MAVIKIENFEPEAVRCIVEFLYTRHYDPSPHQSEASSVPTPLKSSNLAGLSSDLPQTVHQNERDEPSNISYNVQPLIQDLIILIMYAVKDTGCAQ